MARGDRSGYALRPTTPPCAGRPPARPRKNPSPPASHTCPYDYCFPCGGEEAPRDAVTWPAFRRWLSAKPAH